MSLERLQPEAVDAAESDIEALFSGGLTTEQAFDRLNSVLIYYGMGPMSRAFFERYFHGDAFHSLDYFLAAVRVYQSEAMRLFSTFEEAYRVMNGEQRLDDLLLPLMPKSVRPYEGRVPWDRITIIDEKHLPDLGYISERRLRQEMHERRVVSRYLRDLARELRLVGPQAITAMSRKRQRTMDALLRKFESRLRHTPISPLFSPDPVELEREAERIAPREESDLERIASTQAIALENLSHYLTADHMDVYVATSMRTDADFISVNRFVQRLFHHAKLRSLRLRYFNPTQSWVEDRVAKGLVEALMLRRAQFTIYMAQKADSFGKDSEASVALGQGKPVIVYVPKLCVDEVGVDSEEMGQWTEDHLKEMIRSEGDGDEKEVDDTLDHAGLLAQALALRLRGAPDDVMCTAVRNHWADFGLGDEMDRFGTELRGEYIAWLESVIGGDVGPVPGNLRGPLIGTLVANAINFHKRAVVFREVHPLALQVILSTGVLNGILVVRSVEGCAGLLRALIENNLDLDVLPDELNYRLVERSSGSTIRVVSRNRLVGNAFQAFYYRRNVMG